MREEGKNYAGLGPSSQNRAADGGLGAVFHFPPDAGHGLLTTWLLGWHHPVITLRRHHPAEAPLFAENWTSQPATPLEET